VLKFPFPTRPNVSTLRSAINSLIKLKALKTPDSKLLEDSEEEPSAEMRREEMEKLIDDSDLTPLGRVLAYIPLAPKYAKMLLQGRQANCLGYTLLIVSSLSVEELLRTDFNVNIEESDEG
jgi:ATP-dependent RNA helicase DHX37/DHR1